jgi:hypothetical protein
MKEKLKIDKALDLTIKERTGNRDKQRGKIMQLYPSKANINKFKVRSDILTAV